MKKILTLSLAIMLISFMISCGGSSESSTSTDGKPETGAPTDATSAVATIKWDAGAPPAWLDAPSIGTEDGVKYFWFITTGESDIGKSQAQEEASSSALVAISRYLKVKVIGAFAKASQTYGTATSEGMSSVRTFATKSLEGWKTKATLDHIVPGGTAYAQEDRKGQIIYVAYVRMGYPLERTKADAKEMAQRVMESAREATPEEQKRIVETDKIHEQLEKEWEDTEKKPLKDTQVEIESTDKGAEKAPEADD